MTLTVTVHEKGRMTQQPVEVPGPVTAAEAILKAGVTNIVGRALSVLGASITDKTLIEQPGTEIQIHPVPIFG
jgi:hypothetical protein